MKTGTNYTPYVLQNERNAELRKRCEKCRIELKYTKNEFVKMLGFTKCGEYLNYCKWASGSGNYDESDLNYIEHWLKTLENDLAYFYRTIAIKTALSSAHDDGDVEVVRRGKRVPTPVKPVISINSQYIRFSKDIAELLDGVRFVEFGLTKDYFIITPSAKR